MFKTIHLLLSILVSRGNISMMLDSRSGVCFGDGPLFASESQIISSVKLCIRERSIYFCFCTIIRLFEDTHFLGLTFETSKEI